MQYTCKYLSPLGEMLLASDGEALTGAWFEVQKYYAAALAVAHEEKSLPVFEETNNLLFYPVQYEGEESSKNVIYTGKGTTQSYREPQFDTFF